MEYILFLESAKKPNVSGLHHTVINAKKFFESILEKKNPTSFRGFYSAPQKSIEREIIWLQEYIKVD